MRTCNCEKIEDNVAKHVVDADHDYVPRKRKRDATQMETEASECELNHLFMKDSIHCSEGNECEPLDINFSSDLVISHFVIISNLPEPAMETGMAVQTGIAMINEENLEVASGQSNDDFTIPNPSQSYPDDLFSLPMCGFIAQLVKHRTGIAEVTGSNPVEALIFSGFFPIA